LSDEKSWADRPPRKIKMRHGSMPTRAVVERKDLSAVVGETVYNIRKDLNLTQEMMAKRIGLTTNIVSNLERGNKNITLASLSELAVAYDVEPSTLIGANSDIASGGRVTLDTLGQLTRAIDTRVHELLSGQGAAPIGQTHLASVLGALFDAISKLPRPSTRRRAS